MKKIAIFILLFLVGCASSTMSNYVNTTVSEFDGTIEKNLPPTWLNSSIIGLGLFWTSKVEDDEIIILTAGIKGSYNINFGASLHFNIDGELIHLTSIDRFTDIEFHKGFYDSGVYIIPSWNFSSKRYNITKLFLFKLINAKRVVVQIDYYDNYNDNKYSKDEFTKDHPMPAVRALKTFYNQITQGDAFL